MHAVTTNLISGNDSPEIKISHNNNSISFMVSCFGRNSFNAWDVFYHINHYWASLSESNQEYIFSLYKEIMIIFENHWEWSTLATVLNPKVLELLNFHDYHKVRDWVLYKSDIVIPTAFDDDYNNENNRRGTREQTYIKSDYINLVTAAICLRPIIPIWGEYIVRTRNKTGTEFKEFYAFKIIDRANLLECDAYKKINTFIEFNMRTEAFNVNKIIKGISSSDFHDWLLAIITIRRIALGDVSGMNPKAHLVSSIFQYIGQKTKGGGSIETLIKDKKEKEHAGTGDNDLEDKLSVLESYKLKQNISQGELVELEYVISDMRACAYRLTMNMTDDIYYRSVETAIAMLSDKKLSDPQITLMRWIFKPIISPKGLMYMSKDKIVKAMGVTQAVLWARGHKYISLIATSYMTPVENTIHITNSYQKSKISKELVSELDEIYPYFKIMGGKKNGSKPVNLAINSIYKLSDELSASTWTMTADDEFINETLGGFSSRRLVIQPDLNLQLAKLVVELGSRNWI